MLQHSRITPIENQNWQSFSTAVVLWEESFSQIPDQMSALATQLVAASSSVRNSLATDLSRLSARFNLLLLRPVSLQFLTEPWTELYLTKANLNIAISLNEITQLFSQVFGMPPQQQPVWRITVLADSKPPKTALVSRAWRVQKGSNGLAQCNDPQTPCSVNNNEYFAIDALTPDASGYLHYEGQTFGINLGTTNDPEYSVSFKRKPGSANQGPIRYGEPIAVVFQDREGPNVGGNFAIVHSSSTDGSVDLGFTTSLSSASAYQWQLIPIWNYLISGGIFDSKFSFGLKNTSKSSNPFLTRCYAGFSVGKDLGWFLISSTETSNLNCDD